LPALSVDRAWLEEDRARRIAREACEKATVTIAAGSAKAELRPLIRHLCESGQLTAGLVLRFVRRSIGGVERNTAFPRVGACA